ncbi:hypothetical protein WR25_22412 isoform A [Diploscapter pachys]|uniref:Uncharacterized protein n=2 Tax=Diploscapter pachys TaxID=2018661 RepID=A0A2A2JJL4_9BILA|nr:hypothetical protein WR25_22412 isoform A [Diploscapter pachys]
MAVEPQDYETNDRNSTGEGRRNNDFDSTDSPASIRREPQIATIRMSESMAGSESPRSIRDYHKGKSGSLSGGGPQKVADSQQQTIMDKYKDYRRVVNEKMAEPEIRKYKSKLDARLGFCLLICLITIATILGIYGFMNLRIHDELVTYVNRTHQIAKELKLAMDANYPMHNETIVDENGRRWMTVEELEYDAYLLEKTHSTLWCLFWWNLGLALFLVPIVLLVHYKYVEGNGFKLVYRIIMGVCLLFLVAQFLYLIHPILWGAAKFPSMLDRLLMESNPRDEYQLVEFEHKYACEFAPHELLVEHRLAEPCIPKMKNSLMPTYTVFLLMFIDLFPFAFAIFTYAWSACMKNHKHVKKARNEANSVKKRNNNHFYSAINHATEQ